MSDFLQSFNKFTTFLKVYLYAGCVKLKRCNQNLTQPAVSESHRSMKIFKTTSYPASVSFTILYLHILHCFLVLFFFFLIQKLCLANCQYHRKRGNRLLLKWLHSTRKLLTAHRSCIVIQYDRKNWIENSLQSETRINSVWLGQHRFSAVKQQV